MRDPVRAALIRHALNLVVDDPACECYPNDPCLACETYRALGYGKKWNTARARRRLGEERVK